MNRLKEARLAAGLTQQGMSDTLGIPKRTLQDWEGGKRNPPEWVERLVIQELKRYERMNAMKYRIHEIETNVTYDDIYDTREAAEAVIAEYESDDANEREVHYELIETKAEA